MEIDNLVNKNIKFRAGSTWAGSTIGHSDDHMEIIPDLTIIKLSSMSFVVIFQ
jgi:hypothetical protein